MAMSNENESRRSIAVNLERAYLNYILYDGYERDCCAPYPTLNNSGQSAPAQHGVLICLSPPRNVGQPDQISLCIYLKLKLLHSPLEGKTRCTQLGHHPSAIDGLNKEKGVGKEWEGRGGVISRQWT
eukprot:scaffold11075_cov132-Isochrysis_galbana.AAC.12